MKLREIISELEQLAPLSHQDDWDNSGLQVGEPDCLDVDKVLVCLDVTEAVIDEAIATGAQLVLSHHPLLFKGLKSVGDATYQERCTVKAVRNGIAVYSAHTSLDNSFNGVNHCIAAKIGLTDLRWLDSGQPAVEGTSGSGLVGKLPQPVPAEEFLKSIKDKFKVACLRHSAPTSDMISTVALCGGAGAFLLGRAVEEGADCFFSGEFHYHDYFDPGTMLIETGHYESEQFTQDLLLEYISSRFPSLKASRTKVLTNPTEYLF